MKVCRVVIRILQLQIPFGAANKWGGWPARCVVGFAKYFVKRHKPQCYQGSMQTMLCYIWCQTRFHINRAVHSWTITSRGIQSIESVRYLSQKFTFFHPLAVVTHQNDMSSCMWNVGQDASWHSDNSQSFIVNHCSCRANCYLTSQDFLPLFSLHRPKVSFFLIRSY